MLYSPANNIVSGARAPPHAEVEHLDYNKLCSGTKFKASLEGYDHIYFQV